MNVLAANQFECERSSSRSGSLFKHAVDEHVSEVERCIRTLKERAHSTYNSLTFKKCLPD